MDAKGSTEDAALAEAEKEARELEEQLLLKPRVSAAMRRIFEDYSGKHPGEVAEDTDRAPSAEEVAAGEVREAIPPAAELRCSAVVSADATCDEARATIEEPRPPRFLKGSTKARIEDRLLSAGEEQRRRLERSLRERESIAAPFAPQRNLRSEAILAASSRGACRGALGPSEVVGRLYTESARLLRQSAEEQRRQSEHAAHARLERELTGATFTPALNERSRQLAARSDARDARDAAERLAGWAVARDRAHSAKRREATEQEEALMREPELSRGTQAMVARMGRRGRVEDEMAARHAEAQRELTQQVGGVGGVGGR